MAKVHFFYSTMNAGKSTALLQSAHNYHETGNETILFIPREDADKNSGLIKSRIGLSATAVVINSDLKIYEYVKKEIIVRKLLRSPDQQEIFMVETESVMNITLFDIR